MFAIALLFYLRYQTRGTLLVRFGRPDEAREHLEAIRRLTPGSEAERHVEAVLGSP